MMEGKVQRVHNICYLVTAAGRIAMNALRERCWEDMELV